MTGRRARTGRGWDAAPPRPGARRPSGGRRVDAGDPAAEREEGRAGRTRAVTRGPDQTDDPAERAREICLRLLATRPRTRVELTAALRKRGIADPVAREVLDRYDDVGLIDDAAFARAWVSTRHHGRGLARRALATELRQRGVDADTAGQALAELSSETESATARELVERKLRSMARVEPEAAFRRLVGMLARKGYSAGVAIPAVKEALASRSAEAAAWAEQIDVDALADAEATEVTGEPNAAG